MTEGRTKRVFTIFNTIMASPEDKRDALARELCEGDTQLLEEVTELLVAANMGKGDTLDAAIKDAVGDAAQKILGHNHDDFSGRQIGQYQILDLLGQGGMGQVYRALDRRLERQVALKILLNQGNAEWRSRFQREARMVAALNHPNIVTLHGIEEHEGRLILVMELLEGRTLEHSLSPEGMDLETFLGLASALLKALAEAHAKGIVHRDLKPSKIMINERGLVKVLDFGLARSVDNHSGLTHHNQPTLTQTGQIMGTCHYMSPEQARGKSVDQRSDLFSLGIIFYEMLTGNRPFLGGTSSEIISAILKDEPPKMSGSGTPQNLEDIVTRCLAKNPSDRYQDADALGKELQELQGPESARSSNRQRANRSQANPKKRIAGLTLALMIVLIMAYRFTWYCPTPNKNRIDQAWASYTAGKTDEATRTLEFAVVVNPKFALAWAYLSIYYTAQGSSEDALRAAENAVKLEHCLSGQPELDFARSLRSMQYQQFINAREGFTRYLDQAEGDSNIYRQLAHCWFRLEDPPQQVAAYRKARGLDPNDEMSLGGYLIALSDNNEPLKVAAELELFRKRLGSDFWYFYWGEGLAELTMGNFPEAKVAFTAMGENSLNGTGGQTGKSWAVHYLAKINILQGRLHEAAGLLEEGLDRDRQNHLQRQYQEKSIWLARIYHLLGESQRAEEKLSDCVASLEPLPNNLRWLRQAAMSSVMLGRTEEARSLLKGIEHIRDSHPSVTSRCFAFHVRGALCLEENDLDGAETALREALKQLPDSWCMYTLASVFERQGSFKEASDRYREIVENRTGRVMHQDFPDYWIAAHCRLAVCLRKLGRNGEALPYAKRFLAMWGETTLPGVQTARGWEW